MTDRADTEAHLRIAHRSYPAAEWAARLDATSDGGPGWRDYLDEMYRHVWAKDFWTKEIYPGVRLGQRGMRAQLQGGMFSQFVGAYRTSEQALGLTDEAVSGSELARWTEQSERLGRALSASAMHARHATSEEIAWLFRRFRRAGRRLPGGAVGGRADLCWDNTLAESFFASIKGELLDTQLWPTRAATRQAIAGYIAWYNGTRLHSTLGYRSPQNSKTSTATRSER